MGNVGRREVTAVFKPSTGLNPYELHARLLPTPADETAWLLQRREGVGASECAAILGLDRYSTAFSVWLDKVGKVPLSTGMTEAAEWGHLLEPVIRDRAAERLGYDVQTIGGLASHARPWQRASLDAVLHVPGDGPIPLEVKSTSMYLAEEWADDQTPDRAELQVQHQLAVTGAPYGFVAGLIGGQRLVIRRVERDQELIDHINAEEEAFWQHCIDRTEPPIVARDSLSQIVAAAGVPDDGGPLLLDPDDAAEARRWVESYQQAVVDEKAAAAKKAEARNNLVALAQGYTEVCDVAGDVQHTLFKVQRGVFAAKKFVTDEPDLAALFERKVTVVDTAAIKAEDVDLYRRFQSVSIRIPKEL